MSIPLTATIPASSPVPRDPRSLNALKTGVFSRASLLPEEDLREHVALEEEYRRHFQPQSQPEMDVVHGIVSLVWHRRRIEQAEQDLIAQAIRETDNRLPEPVIKLANEVHHQDVELRILSNIVERLDSEDQTTQEQMLVGFTPVLDLLLGWNESVADMDPSQAVLSMKYALNACRKATETSREFFRSLLKVHETLIKAIRSEAALLSPEKAERLRKERVSIERSIKGQVETYRKMRGGVEVEARFSMTGDPKTVFSETKSVTPGNGAAA